MLSLLYVVLSGIALPVGGIQMQYLWRNQLGDVYSLGLGSAACLGAAAATMSGWCTLTVGSFACTLLCTLVCFAVTLKLSTQNLITFGIIFGTFISSLCTIVVTNAPDGELLRRYYLWGAANFRLEDVTALRKAVSLLMIMFLVTSVVSICGPIGFISLGVPNLSRAISGSTDIRRHYLISGAMGVALLLLTYLVVNFSGLGIYLPVSATMAIIALPLMFFLFRKSS